MRAIDADLLLKCIPSEEVISRGAVLNAPTIEPDWNEMLVICDNCGHAIHVKRLQAVGKAERCEDGRFDKQTGNTEKYRKDTTECADDG